MSDNRLLLAGSSRSASYLVKRSRATGLRVSRSAPSSVPRHTGHTTAGRPYAAPRAPRSAAAATAVVAAVKRLAKEFDVRPENLRAAIGASAGPCCYEVGSDVIDAFTSKFTDGEKLFRQTRPGHATVDLLQANRDQLISTGVNPERIHTAPICTMCRTDLFFSYGKEKSLQGKVGRLMAVVGRR